MARDPKILGPATVLTNHKGETVALLTGARASTLAHLGVKRLCLGTEPTKPGEWKAEPMGEEGRVMTPGEKLNEILAELKAKQHNAAMRNKSTMWAYYLSTRRALVRWYGPSRNGGGVAGKALALIQIAERHYGDRVAARAAQWAALAVYSRRILRTWVSGCRMRRRELGSLQWLRDRADED